MEDNATDSQPVSEPTAGRPNPRRRTKKQQEASRANGRKGRGPKTVAGKERSRQNSMVHGLLARTLPPVNTFITDRWSADSLLANMMEDYRPKSQLAATFIEALGVDIMRLERVLALIDLKMDPGQVYQDFNHIESFRYNVEKLQRLKGLYGILLQALPKKIPPAFTQTERDILIEDLWCRLNQEGVDLESCREYLDDARTADPPDEDRLQECEREFNEAQEAYNKDGAPSMGIDGAKRLADVILAKTSLSEQHHAALCARVSQISSGTDEDIAIAISRNAVANSEEKRRLAAQSIDYTLLETLQKYESHIRRNIDRDLANLERVGCRIAR